EEVGVVAQVELDGNALRVVELDVRVRCAGPERETMLNRRRGRGRPFRTALPPGRRNFGREPGGGIRGGAPYAVAAPRQRGAAAGGEAFRRREWGRRPGEHGGGVGRDLRAREGAQEVEPRGPGERAGQAAGGEHVVGVGDVVAERDGAV